LAGLVVELGGIKQRLRGNAPDVEAGAAQGLVLLDHRSLEAELCSADCADISAGDATDHDHIVGCHAMNPENWPTRGRTLPEALHRNKRSGRCLRYGDLELSGVGERRSSLP